MKRIFSLILVLMAVQMMWAAPFTVTNTSDDADKEGSLRWACNQASSNKSVEITFDIEGDGNKVIKLTNQIQIQGNVTIDASSSKDSIIIDANDMEYADYCFYINNYNSAKLNLKGLVLKNRKTSAIYLSSSDYYENTVDVQIDSCFFYGDITAYGGNLIIKNSSLNHSVIASTSESTYLEIVDCEFVNAQNLSVRLTIDPAKFVCSRTTFSREGTTLLNPIYYVSESKYSTPVIDTAYVRNGKLFVNGHIASNEVVDIELFTSSNASYISNSDNRYECKKYLGTTKTNSNGIFRLEMTLPEKGLMLKQHFILSASATYAKAHTSSFAFYDVKQPYWVVNTTLDGKSGSDFIVGSMRWACHYASANDTIVFDFPGKGKKEIEGFNYSTNGSVDGSTYADTIILHGLHCYNVNKIVSENVSDGHGFSIAGGKMTNCISRNNKTGVEIYIGGISVENCIIEKNRDFGIHGYHSFNKIKHTIIRENNIGVSSSSGGKCIEECDIINNIIGISSTSHPSILDSVISCWISGNDSVGMYGSRIIYGNNIGLDKDQKTAMPNGYGIIVSQYTDVLKDNVVAGNFRCGILVSQNHSLDTFVENFIGTNRNLDVNPLLGNGEDGLRAGKGEHYFIPNISKCYFMNNHGSGINAMLEGTVSSCVFSNNSVNGAIFTDFKGLSRFKQCSFSDNKKGGLALLGQSDIIDIDSCEFSRNGGYGLSISQINLDLNNTTFDSNQKEAIVNDNARSLLSNNKFLNTVRPYPAFKTTNPYPVPEFTSCKMTKTTIVIEGKIDTAAKAKIELFYTSQGEQTAEMLVDSFYTNPDGTFSDTLDRSMFVGKSVISFNATATYGKITSPLSDLVSPSLGRVDLASTEFYVKMDGYGDGSSWENAMNLQTFIYYLPQVMNGSTFYVAEGRYVPTSKGFKINSSVSIVGGFSPDATSGAVADPVRYKTVFTGDPSGDDVVEEKSLNYEKYIIDQSGDDVVMESSFFSGNENSEIHFSGCEISGNMIQNTGIISPVIYCGNLYLSDCTIGNTCNIGAYSKKKMIAENCIFRNMFSHSSPSSIFCHDSVYVKNSTFENITGRNGSCFNRVRSLLDIKNSIFSGVDINDGVLIQSTNEVYLFNNTFVNVNPNTGYGTSYLFVAKDSLAIVGNIFKNCKFKSVANITDHTFIKHNLCENILGTDDDINTGDFADSVVDGVYNKTTGTFVPTYSDWGGYVPTIVTKSDTLPDGRSIRFSLNETKVLTDQRGVSRLPKTCMGAYEIGCGSDTTFSTDTINVGTKIYGQTFTKVGVHDSIFETLQSAGGCDSVVMHKVVVKPDPTKLNYYVKMEKVNKGDGSDWDNAMDGTDFATYLPLAPAGATFYVAEGEYKLCSSLYDWGIGILYDRSFFIQSNVSILGGYSNNSSTNTEIHDNMLYPTIFSGDCGEKTPSLKDYILNSSIDSWNYDRSDTDVLFYIADGCDVKFKDLFFESSSLSSIVAETGNLMIEDCFFQENSSGIANDNASCISSKGSLILTNCAFEYNKCQNGYSGLVYFADECTIKNCSFSYNYGAYSPGGFIGSHSRSKKGKLSVIQSIFINNNKNNNTPSATLFNVNESLSSENCVYINNNFSKALILNRQTDSVSVSFVNNTVVCDSLYDDVPLFQAPQIDAEFSGNILCMHGNEFVRCNGNKINSKYNLFSELNVGSNWAKYYWTPSATDIVVEKREDAYALFDDPSLSAVLIKDKLYEDVSIRFPLTETAVSVDQRGVSRLDMTCMGAYELGCGSDTTIATKADTINVGEKILGQTFTKVGVHDSIFETLQSAGGCDSVVMHKVVVKPDPTKLNYYVKMNKENDGDGRDWDNAMSGEDFATYLPLAPDGAIFYVAAGTYKPKYDVNLSVPSDSSNLCYTINGDVTIRGGYPADATGKDVPSEPKKYETIFDGDIKGDDVIDETLGENGYVTVKAENRENNSQYMFYSNSQKELHVGFDGVYVKNASGAIYILNLDKYVRVSNSKFVLNNNAIFMPYEGENLEVYNTSFSKHFGRVVYMPTASNLTMDSILFENNQSNLIYIPGTPGVNPDHNVRLNRLYAYANGDSSYVIYTIGHDFVLSNSEFRNNRGMLYLYDNTRIDSSIFENNFGFIEKYGTLGFEINECSFIDNKANGIFINSAKNGTELNHFSITKSSFKNTISNGLFHVVSDSINVEKTEISGSTNGYFELNGYEKAILSECYIHDNNTHFEFIGTETYVKKNSISNNICVKFNDNYELITLSGSAISGAYFVNNTITSNVFPKLMDLHGTSTFMQNNTIIGNVTNDVTSRYLMRADPGVLNLTGNIILGNSPEIIRSRWSSYNYQNNVLPRIQVAGASSSDEKLDQKLLTENIFSIFDHSDDIHEELKDIANRNEEILTTLFDGTYDNKTGLFTPVLAYNGGFTPTVALKSDKLSDGRSIRFPRLENVLTDQRGVSRDDMTCMGAYEMGCFNDTTIANDTIYVGEKILGQTFTKVGVHDSISETLQSVGGCDSVVMHRVIVKPDSTVLNYYVKTKKVGDGDGRDWDNAMDSTDFATYLPLAPDGAVFYVAEGEYRPVYDDRLAETDYLSTRQFTVTGDVTIRGGFPSTAKGTNVNSDPKKYKTVFDGLIKSGDDETNVNALFHTSVVKDIKLSLDGVTLSNSNYAVAAYSDVKYPKTGFDVNLDYVSFVNNDHGVSSSSNKGSININHSEFENNNSCVYSYHSNVFVKNSSFEKCGIDYLINISTSHDVDSNVCVLHIDSSSFVGNTRGIQTYNELIIKNSIFDSNKTNGNLMSTWNDSEFSDFKVELINNTFVGNKMGHDILENYAKALTTVDQCVFADNECGNDMLRANDMSVTRTKALRNIVEYAMFNSNNKSTFISDTIEGCTANDIVKYSSEGCKVDSCLIKNNDAYLLSFTPNTKIGNLKYDLLNSEIVGNTKTNMASDVKVINFLCSHQAGMENDSVNIIRTKFRNNKYNDCSFIFNYYTFLNFDQCQIDSNEVKVFVESRFSQSHIYNSTFADNNCDIVLQCSLNGNSYSEGTGATYMNNTMVRNKCKHLIDGYYSNSTYLNNTIVGNVSTECLFKYFHNPAFIGNLVFGNTYDNLFDGILITDENISSNVMPTFIRDFDLTDHHITFLDGNIMSDQYYDEMTKDPSFTNDVKGNPTNHLEDLTSLFDGTYNNKTGLFTPVLKDNGGFTPTVALKSDMLSDGTSIRFTRLEDVLTDQRGEPRFEETCMGAFEFFKNHDTVYVNKIDTVCLGLEYDRNGWQLQSDTLPVGEYEYVRFLRGKIATDTIETLTLHVNPFSPVLLDQVAVAPTLCHGDGYGEVSFTSYSVVPGSAIVYVMDETGDSLSSDVQIYNSVYNNKKLPLGKFDINIISQTQCVEDTSIHIEVVDRDSLSPLNQIDNILTDCANEPTSMLSVSLKGFHPTMKFYHNDVEITKDSKSDALVYEDDAAVTSLANLNLSDIPVGKHVITAVDACENTYVVSEFEVSVSPSELVEMQLVDYTKDTLACGLDNGFAKFNIVSGATSLFTLTSDEGYNYNLSLHGKDTVLVLNDLTRGNYKALLKKVDENCSDSSDEEFSIFSPEPLSLSLTSNGAACAEGAVSAVAEGGSGSYTFHWTDPNGKTFDTTTPKLSEASAGTYTCVVEDATHCLSHTESLSILPDVEELSELHVDSVVTKNITCISGNNGTIEVRFSTDNMQQSVACAVTNDATGEVTSVAGTYKKSNGLLAIRTLGVGSYSYEVYYGSETCRLDTNSIKGKFKISAKAVQFAMKPLSISAPQTCFNPANGTISNTVTGWENDYKAYLMTKAGGKYRISPVEEDGETKLKVDTLSAGSFYYVVEDACGSKINTDTISLPEYEPLSLKIVSFTDSVTCARATDAEIKFVVDGGIGMNHLAYVDEKSYTDKDTIISRDNGKGIHTVAYKSVVDGCKDSIGDVIRIAGPDTLAIKFTLNGNCPGSALIPEVTGESGPYTYWWSDGENDIEGTAEFPFEMEEGRTYSLTVSDDHKCDEYTKSFTIPSASELPSVSHVVSPSSEKCYKGNNGSIKVKASISEPLDFAISATIKCEKVDDPRVSFVYQCVLDPDGTYSTPETLSPGYYRVTTRLGSFDCDMGVDPVEDVVHVDTLSPLKIQSDFQLTPHTCEQANGTAKFNVEGWVNTHKAVLYTLDKNITAEIKPAYVTNYVARFGLKLRYGKYMVVVTDKCGQSDTSEIFEILHKPTFVDKVTSEPATCINEPNGVLDFNVQGWTSNHTCELINKDNAASGYFGNVKPVEVVDSIKFAHFRIETVPAGEWRIRVTNECGDNCQFENLVKVGGIDPYKVELIANESKLELTCPYDTDGVITLNVTGGCKDASLSGNTTQKVTYWGPTGIFVDSFVWEEKEIYTLVPIYDTLNPIIENDTTFKIVSMDTIPGQDGKDSIVINYDTIVTQRTTYPQLVDEEGNLVNDTIVTIDSIQVSIPVEKYGWLDSLATSPIEYDAFIADPDGFKSGKYKFENLRAATYRFTYKSTLKGCTDKYNFDTKVTKPEDVRLNYSVMSITCSSKSDGEISLAPRRGNKSYTSYFVGHDPNDVYEINRLYKHDLIEGKDSIVEYLVNDETQTYQIDQLYDKSDLTSVSWSFSQTKNGKFVQMTDLIFPDSSDFYEEIYYKNGNPTTSPVYSKSHLEKFWNDDMGEYFEANVVSIANLRHGFYEALVVDNKACKYRDTIEVKYPAKPLKIDSVVFDETLAECDPTARQIISYVSGGWGDYGFSFSDENTSSDSPGEKSDGYRGGEASYSDNGKLEGWGVSSFLDPGTYKVAVFDKNGCIVESPDKYTVKTTFSLSIDTVETTCAEDDSAAVTIKFLKSPESGVTFDVVEYESPCRTDAMDECREFTLNTKMQNVTPDGNSIVLNLSSEKRRIKTHGLFVYKNDEKHCGTYVEGTVVDTIPIFKSSRKSVKDATCNGMSDGMIELFVSGGKSPYVVQRNSSWNSGDELALYADLKTFEHSDTLKMIDLKDSTKSKDTIIITKYVQIPDLAADSFYLTVIDSNGCRSVMGNPANYDEKIFVKEPDALHADFAASIVCKDPSVTTGGNVFFQNLTGGVAPYTLSCSYENNGPVNLNDCEAVTQIPVAKEGFSVSMMVTDANHCTFDSVVTFRPGELNIDQYDFWATSWYEFGDIVALIDVCGPDDIFDSVSYVFRKEDGTVDPRIKILDERMYIYDLESNRSAQNTLLHYADKTKEVVPDLFFKKNFRLKDGITEDQAKHLHFFKFEDSSIDVTNANDLRDVLAEHTVLMKAYFNGCEYQVDRQDPLGVTFPDRNNKLDKIGQRYQIISLTGSPNPFKSDEAVTIRATFTEKVDADLYFYHIDGKTSKSVRISSAELNEKDGEFVYSQSFTPSELFNSDVPDYIIVFLTTGRDQKAITLLHSGAIDFSKTDD